MIPQEKIEQALLNELKEWDLSCSEEPSIKTALARALTNVIVSNYARFAEAEFQTFEIDFCGHVKAKLKVKDGKLSIIAMNGYGDALDPDQIIITQLEQ